MECYFAIKFIHTAMWMNLENIMLNERSQSHIV